MKTNQQRIMSKIHKEFKKPLPKQINLYSVIGIVTFSVIFAGAIFGAVAHNIGYQDAVRDVQTVENEQQAVQFLAMDFQEAKEVFYKGIMWNVWDWSAWIVLGLVIGWILHGVF